MLYAVLSADTQNTLKYHLVTVKPSFTVKTIDCMHQTYRKENGKIRYITHMLHDYHVRNGVGCCVKNGSYSSPTWSENQLLGYLTILMNISCYEAHHWWQFYLSARQCTNDYHIQHTHLRFFLGYGPKTVWSLTPMTTRFRDPHSSNSMSCNKT